MYIKQGTRLLLTEGSYDAYTVCHLVIALRDIDVAHEIPRYLMSSERADAPPTHEESWKNEIERVAFQQRLTQGLFAFLLHTGALTEEPYEEINSEDHLGTLWNEVLPQASRAHPIQCPETVSQCPLILDDHVMEEG